MDKVNKRSIDLLVLNYCKQFLLISISVKLFEYIDSIIFRIFLEEKSSVINIILKKCN